jgi:hypothetical protein
LTVSSSAVFHKFAVITTKKEEEEKKRAVEPGEKVIESKSFQEWYLGFPIAGCDSKPKSGPFSYEIN